MTVFYRVDRNPHGPSRRPVMTIALEQSDIAAIMRKGLGIKAPANSGMTPPVLGVISSQGKMDFQYDGPLTSQAIKNEFFKMIEAQLGLVGQPRCIGTIAQAYGNTETGLPPKERGGNNSGCAVLLFIGTGLAALAAWGISFI